MAESAGVFCPLPSEQDNVELAQGNPVLDSSTFIPPLPLASPSIIIEFCDRCRWLHRATWVSTELFLTFPPPALKAISIIPLNSEETGGRFRVWLNLEGSPPQLMWDRKIEGGFPELKGLKQRIRDHVQPGKSLGHSDKKSE
ncbi:Rdx family-domain-containing protein [Suillus bovinus]|uniref:Rdx family-domain-containing protein n=1 Tax=Suillus bovinus TaxID=48563 RepID=UPI001B86393E|nr:Rdx family-domain-containing protein [Suillus bovinus]KAG2158869.1 Rdx family-domain-containing protein [Suillus bovinus]